MQLSQLSVSAGLLSVTCLSLALFLAFVAKNRLQRILLLLNLCVTVWGIGLTVIGVKTLSLSDAALWWKITHTGGFLISVVFMQLMIEICEIKRDRLIFFAYLQAIFFIILNWIGLGGYTLKRVFDSFYYVQACSFTYLVLSALWFFWMLYGFYVVIRKYLKLEGHKKTQFKYLVVAMIVGYLGGTSHFYLAFGLNIYPFPILIALYSLIQTYAIFRHQLLDIEVIVKKTLVFAGLLASVFTILILPTLLIQEYVFRDASMGGRLIGLTISGVIIILTMRRLENFLINVTDKYLFQKKYDYKELLKTFTSEVLTVLSLGKLVNLTVDKLDDIMKLNSSAVLLFDEFEGKFNIMASRNLKDSTLKLSKSDNLVAFLEHVHGYFSRKEMAEKKIFIPSNVQDVIDKLNAELMIPMVLQEKMIGILSLGKKKSDEDYTQDDLDILLPLARTLAIAISNAQLFEQLGKAQAEAAQKEKMAVIGTLSAGINHEICNPLGIARGQCEAFLLNIKDGLYDNKTPQELLDKAKYIMELVMKEVDRATVITKKLSSFAKPAKGVAETVNINTEVDYVLSLVGHELKLEKIEVEKDIPPDTLYIYVDKKQFEEVLFNLIRNAGQAIGEKGKITVSVRQLRDKVIIDISDTGSGIPDDKLRELFNPFFTTKGPDKGTGLGLFIVRQVVEKNKGRIYLKETKVGHGTTFTIEFPAMSPEMVAQSK